MIWQMYKCTQHKTIDISFHVEHNNWSVLDDNIALVGFMSSRLNFHCCILYFLHKFKVVPIKPLKRAKQLNLS